MSDLPAFLILPELPEIRIVLAVPEIRAAIDTSDTRNYALLITPFDLFIALYSLNKPAMRFVYAATAFPGLSGYERLLGVIKTA
jgi:hypothetical protein